MKLNHHEITNIDQSLVDAGFKDVSYINDEFASISPDRTDRFQVYVSPDNTKDSPRYQIIDLDTSDGIFSTDSTESLIKWFKTRNLIGV